MRAIKAKDTSLVWDHRNSVQGQRNDLQIAFAWEEAVAKAIMEAGELFKVFAHTDTALTVLIW